MALFDFLKRKKEVAASREPRQRREKAKQGKKPAKKTSEVKVEEKVKKSEPVAKAKKASGFSFEAIGQPHISEKATYLMKKNQYIFKVPSGYNKNEIKKAVEGIYGVNVLSVNLIKIPPKKRRIGRTQGFKKGLVKAIVKINEEQKIEIL